MQINFNTNRLDILPTDESYRYRSIMGEHTLTLYFSLPTYTEIPTGAWCEFQGERYTLNQPAKIVKHNSFSFEYTLTMDSEGANLKNYKFRNSNDKTLKFPFTASPRYHIQILVDCLNMIDSGWTLGTTIEAPEKLISYNHNNCLEALDMIAKAFETEYEIIGKTIHLHKVEYFKDNPLPLQYGKGKGFKTGVSRTTEQSRITRLYVQGGDRNIDRSKYGNKELLLPKSQEYTYEGVTFLSDNKGLSIAIKNAQNNGFVNEQSLDLSHIYPRRKGTISTVFEVDKAKHFYDFTDTTIPQALNFWDMRINGEKMLIYFESGMLSGREFEVNHYDHTQKRFQLQPKEEDGATMPNDIFKPAVGDKYSVYNMQMPNAYICDYATKSGASWEMMKEACKYLYENRANHFTFTGDLDGIWAKKHWVNVGGRLKMGAYIHFSDTEFQRTPVAIRIVGLKEYVNNPYSPQIELSNKVQGQSFATEIRKLQNQEVYFGELNKRTLSETKRSWRNALETIKQVEEAFPEYTKSIIPATIQTMMALVGNKSGQFVFVSSKTHPITVPHSLYFNKATKQLNAGSGWIKHYALGTTDIKPNYSAADYKYWYAPAFVSGRLDDKAKTYYLYIKASKVVETAEFVLSETKIDIEQEAGYYHFLYATVNSEFQGERGIAQLNGFTEITGGQIKTDKISSGNGEQFIQLLDNEIIIKANLHITDGNKTEIKQLVNPDLLSLENKLKQYTNDQANNIQVGGRNYILKSNDFITSEYKFLNISPLFRNEVVKSDSITLSVDIMFNNLTKQGRLGIEFSIIYADNTEVYYNVWKWINGDNIGASFSERMVNTIKNNHKGKKIKEISQLGLHVQCEAESIKISNPKLEIGNKPTDWSPAPEDLENQIQTEQQVRSQAINEANANTNAKFLESKTFAEQKANAEKQAREQAIATAKAATEEYARAQSELTKAQAIAEANKQAGIAITAEQQARILQLQQNLQQAKTFAEQKVNELNIGGRNLLRETKDFIVNGQSNHMGFTWSNNAGEPISERFNGNVVRKINGDWQGVKANMPDIIGEPVTISFWAKTNSSGKFENFATINKNPSGIGQFTERSNNGVLISDNQWHRYTIYNSKGMCLGEGSSNGFIEFFNVSSDIYYSSIKIEIGNKPTDWSPAPEDIENKVADIQTDLQNAINNAKALIAVETQNRQQTDANVSKLVNKTNFLSDTYIDGNTMATGTMILGNSLGVQAGITGVGAANNDVRLWAGSNYTNRANAPFQVLQDGTLHATNANISGHVEATSGSFKGHVEAKSGQIGNFKIVDGFIQTVLPKNHLSGETQDSWTPRSNFVSINDKFILYRINGLVRGEDHSQVIIGHTAEAASGRRGALQAIRSVQNSQFVPEVNTALSILAKGNNNQENIALDIIDGDIKVKGQKGYTGIISINMPYSEDGTPVYKIFVTNGIITNFKIEYI